MYETLETMTAGGVATVALNRPEVRNAFNARMISELTEEFSRLAGEESVRVIVLCGNGRLFSAGADVNWMHAGLDFTHEENLADAGRMSDMFAVINAVPKPVVGRVHGAALGGGMGLLAVCDIVVAAEDTVFGFTETKLGIIPAVISRFVVPRIGQGWARALFLTGERFDSGVAHAIGLAHWICPFSELEHVTAQKVEELFSGGPLAIAEAKSLIREVANRNSDDLRELTTTRIAAIRTSPEGQEGLRAFLEKREPSWKEMR